jgi:predicted NodU family carbamoyl transferase
VSRIVVGVFDGPSGGAAVLRGGELLAVADEDRLVRRHRVSGLPRASVQSVLRESGIPSPEAAAVLVATRDATYAEGVGSTARPPLLVRVGTSAPALKPISRIIHESFASSRRRRIDEALRSEFGFSCPILFLDHHLVHAVGSVFASGLEDALAITMDGGADGAWATVSLFRKGKPERLVRETGSVSFLAFLEDVCERLGIVPGIDRFRRLEDLAKRGEPAFSDRMSALFQVRKGRVEVPEGILRTGGAFARIPSDVRREDLACSALRVVEHSVREVVSHFADVHDDVPIALGGDLFEICPIVRAAIEAARGRAVHVPPACGDDGLAVGAAFGGCLPGFLAEPLPIPRARLSSPFLGISYGDDQIEMSLATEGYAYRRSPDIEREIARVLAEGKSVARFDGRTELGNSSLGNRSILRSPLGALRRGQVSFVLSPNYYHALVPVDAFPTMFEPGEVVPENLLAAPMPVTPKPRLIERCPDLVGSRGRMKVQTLTVDSNPRLFKILREFELWTGVPCLAVAPFRLPDEPLVSTPLHALRTLRFLGADYAAFGSFLARGTQVEERAPAESESSPPFAAKHS